MVGAPQALSTLTKEQQKSFARAVAAGEVGRDMKLQIWQPWWRQAWPSAAVHDAQTAPNPIGAKSPVVVVGEPELKPEQKSSSVATSENDDGIEPPSPPPLPFDLPTFSSLQCSAPPSRKLR